MATAASRTRIELAAPVEPPRPEDLTASQLARRERIVDQAFTALRTREYDDIQIKEIAEQAGVALGTVYRYFTSKEHLFAAALVKWGEALRTQVRRSPLSGHDVAAQLCDVYLRTIDGFERRPQFFRALMVIEQSTDRHAKALWTEFSAVSGSSLDQPLAALDPAVVAVISRSMLHVLHGELRAWSRGLIDIATVRATVTSAIGLLVPS